MPLPPEDTNSFKLNFIPLRETKADASTSIELMDSPTFLRRFLLNLLYLYRNLLITVLSEEEIEKISYCQTNFSKAHGIISIQKKMCYTYK